MNRKYEVFISSNGDDSTELRNVCFDLTRQAGFVGSGRLSSIGAMDFAAELTGSDIFVCICHSLTDSVARQCQIAVSKCKPILLFVVTDDPALDLSDFERLVSDIPGSVVRRVDRVEPYYFGTFYLLALHRVNHLLSVHRKQANTWTAPRARNRLVQRLLQRLESWPVVYRRIEHNATLKEAIANFFWSLYLPLIVHSPIQRLFFESGSSIAYVSEAYAGRLEEDWMKASRKPAIETNNILTYIEFVLDQSLRVNLYPDGPPERRYGATFGPLAGVDEMPGARIYPIEGATKITVAEIRDQLIKSYAESGLMLGATSGIDMSSGEHSGPHCGSRVNAYFKRAMMEASRTARCPLVLFLDDDKLPRPFIPERCFSVCGDDLSWQDVCQHAPVALACAFETEANARRILPALAEMGFRHQQEERQHESPWCVIACNDSFWALRSEWYRRYEEVSGAGSV